MIDRPRVRSHAALLLVLSVLLVLAPMTARSVSAAVSDGAASDDATSDDATSDDAVSDDATSDDPPLELLALEVAAQSAVVRVAGNPVPRLVEPGDVIEPLGWWVVAVHAQRLVVRAPVIAAPPQRVEHSAPDPTEPRASDRLLWIHPRTAERPTWIQPVGLDAGARRGDPDTVTIPLLRPLDEGAFVVDLPDRFRPEGSLPTPR